MHGSTECQGMIALILVSRQTAAQNLPRLSTPPAIPASSLPLDVDVHALRVTLVDTAGQKVYFASMDSPAKVIKVDVNTWTKDATLVLDDGYNMITSGAIDSDHAYFGCMTNPGKIAKVRLSDFTQVGGLSLCSGQCSFTTTLSLDTDGMLYAGTSRNTDGLIVKVASNTMLEIGDPIILPARRAGAAAIFTSANPHFLVVGLYNKAQGLPPNGTKYQIVDLSPFQLGSTFQANGIPLELYAANDNVNGQVLMAHEVVDTGVVNLNDGKAKNSRFNFVHYKMADKSVVYFDDFTLPQRFLGGSAPVQDALTGQYYSIVYDEILSTSALSAKNGAPGRSSVGSLRLTTAATVDHNVFIGTSDTPVRVLKVKTSDIRSP